MAKKTSNIIADLMLNPDKIAEAKQKINEKNNLFTCYKCKKLLCKFYEDLINIQHKKIDLWLTGTVIIKCPVCAELNMFGQQEEPVLEEPIAEVIVVKKKRKKVQGNTIVPNI